ncbi:MAG: 50S ribosomal protein L25 [Chloroflexi bacterium]|nr:50S ribosomal protein L25 [Chloroflexota bacterium]
MAEALKLVVAERTAARKANKQIRREGQVPVHVFGHGMESVGLQAEEKELRGIIRRAGGTGLIQVEVDGKSHNVMVREVQKHPVTGRLTHVDLYRVRMDHKTRARVPLAFVGEAPGVTMHDGVLLHALEALNIEALPGDLPHNLEVDISVLAELDQALHVRDISVPAAVTVLDDPEEVVVKIQPPRRVEEPEVSEEAVEEPSAEGAPAAEAEAESEPEAAEESEES